jgi:hypothetical protein
MDQSAFEAADRVLDEIADLVDQTLTSDQLIELRRTLSKLSKALGDRYSASLTVVVEVFDREQERCLPLLNTGLASSEGGDPYQTWGDSSPQRYVIDGQIQVVPHDRCPKCWGEWACKLQNRCCSHCDATLGGNCKILLDTDICPHCEKGKVSLAHPKCEHCGFEAVPADIVWG